MKSKLTLPPAKFGRGMKRRNGRGVVALSVILTAMIAAGSGVGLRRGQAQSGGRQPNYENVDDFLNGGRQLLRNDDLVMTFNYYGPMNDIRQVLFTGGTNDSNSNVLTYDQRTVPNGQAGCTLSGGCNFDYYSYDFQSPVTGRFFNTVRDTTVLYPLQFSNSNQPLLVSLAGKTVGGSSPAAGLTWTTAQDVSFVIGGNQFPFYVADFNGDGYDDLLMAWSSQARFSFGNRPANPRMRIATAVDVNDPTKGFTFGPLFTPASTYGIREMTVGDFNGDRHPEIAQIYTDSNKAATLATYSVDPVTLTISEGGQLQFLQGVDPGYQKESQLLAAGHFTSVNHQQLVAVTQPKNGGQVYVTFFDFDKNSIQPKKMTSVLFPDTGFEALKLKAGRFNWSSPYDQIAWMSSTIDRGTRLSVLTVDPVGLNVSRKADIATINDPGSRLVGYDIAVGNFDRMQPSIADPSKQERNPDLQIALLGGRYNPSANEMGTAALYIYDVSDDYLTLTQKSRVELSQTYFGGNIIRGMSIAAGDLQGRSMRLGAGYKVTVDRTQPSVILAMPPMHADYVSPGIGKAPTVFNLSVGPDGFKSEYEQTQSTDASVTQTDTTSSSFAGEEKISAGVVLGQSNPLTGELENGVDIKTSFTAKQDLKNSTDTINGAFNSSEIEISQETGLSDVVWFTDSSYYLYVYPVIGRKICPADKPNCKEDEKVPLRIMFSAPLPSTAQHLASDTLEWYQPPWEFGNLLSYPAGLAQLKQYMPDIQLLTQDQNVFATDDAAATLRTTWANGRTTGQNTENEKLFTEEADISIEGKTSIKPFGIGGSGTLGLDLNFGGSTGTKSLNESETKFNSARGITVTKTAIFADPPTYKYLFSPLIFGKVQPVGYTDPINSSADLLSFGALRSAFTANPLARSAGSWWSQSPYRNFPDVAVNHPTRWVYTKEMRTGPNCVGLDGITSNCVWPQEREPENPWNSKFHNMRGLFITNATNPPSSNTLTAPGSQLETATEGDQLNLLARVYNYSFRAMPQGTKVKVRFYGMLLDEQNLPVNEGGGSFLIGEDVLGPIPPFSSDPQAPLNWVLARATFDTKGRANQALAFWVAVWMEDDKGNLVQELPSHGLTGKPAGEDPAFEEIAALEEMVDNPVKRQDDPAQVSFSNNIGFYHSVFHVLPKTPTPVPGPIAAAGLTVEKVEVSGDSLKPGRSVEGSVMLRNGAEELLGVTVYFYNGDPAAGGRLVDVERVARLRAGGQQKVSIRFRPQVCGAHRLFVRVAPGRAHAASGQAAQSVQVECPEPVCASRACMRSAQYYALNLNRLPQGVVTVPGNGVETRVSTGNTERMRLLLRGGTAAQQRFTQQFVATQLSLLGQPGGDQAQLRSNLLCYGLNFQPTQLGTGAFLDPSMTLGELLDQARLAGRSGTAVDQRLIASVLELLNGDDPQGRCR